MSPDLRNAPWPAFKEWAAIVAALGAGAQSLILRKGGIAEGKGGFDPTRATRFWLYPTSFHAQLDKLKPAAATFFDPHAPTSTPVALDTFAEVVSHRFVTDWEAVAALDSRHLWTEPTVRERFDWSRPAGLHVLEVEIFRLHTPLRLTAGLDTGGCKSWIDLPLGDPKLHCAFPVTARA